MAPPCRGPLRFGGHAEPGRLSRNQGWRQITCFFVINDVGHRSLGPGVQPLEQVRWRRCAGPAAPPHRAARPQSGRIAPRVAGGSRRGKTSRQVRRSTTARPPARTATSDHPVRAIHTAPAQRAPRRLRRRTTTIDAPATPRATAARSRPAARAARRTGRSFLVMARSPRRAFGLARQPAGNRDCGLR